MKKEKEEIIRLFRRGIYRAVIRIKKAVIEEKTIHLVRCYEKGND